MPEGNFKCLNRCFENITFPESREEQIIKNSTKKYGKSIKLKWKEKYYLQKNNIYINYEL